VNIQLGTRGDHDTAKVGQAVHSAFKR